MKFLNNKYYGLFNEIGDVASPEDLDIFNCVDTGVQYRFFEGKWYKQPVYWTDKDDVDAGGGGSDMEPELPPVTSEDDGDVLTVVDGAWAKAEPQGNTAGNLIVTVGADFVLSATWQEMYDAFSAGSLVLIPSSADGFMQYSVMTGARSDEANEIYEVVFWTISPFGSADEIVIESYSTYSPDEHPGGLV